MNDWITNLHKNEVEAFRRETSFKIRVGAPRATENYNTDQLRRMGMVGIYKI